VTLLKVADFCLELTYSTGTGTLALAGAPAGYRTLVAGVGSGAQVGYSIYGGGQFETGIGTVTSGSPDTLSRDVVLASSNANALVNFAAGEKRVAVTPLAARWVDGEAAAWPTLPALGASSVNGTHTYAANSQQAAYASWVQGGRRFVWSAGRLVISSKDGTMSGNVRLLNLPFAAVNRTGFTQAIACTGSSIDLNVGGGYTKLSLFTVPNATYLELYEDGDNVAPAAITHGDVGAAGGVYWNDIYEAAP